MGVVIYFHKLVYISKRFVNVDIKFDENVLLG